jgi:hypothetical protein
VTEECQLLKLLFRNGHLVKKAVEAGLTTEHFQTEMPRQLYSFVVIYYEQYVALMPRPALDAMFPEKMAIETTHILRSKYDTICGQFAIEESDFDRLLAQAFNRLAQRQAFHICQDNLQKILEARCDQDKVVERFRQSVAEISDGRKDNARFPLLTPAQLSAVEPKPEDHILGEGWLRRGAGTLLTGGTGIGKSVLGMQAGICVAAGMPWLGLPSKGSRKVLLVQAENDEETMARDITSISEGIGIEGDALALLDANLRVAHAYGLTGEALATWLAGILKEYPADLVVIDPYQSYLGARDINKSDSFLSFIGPLDSLAKSSRFALLLVAHTTKPRDTETWSDRESVYMAAGTSAISNWARTSCELTQEANGERFRLRFGKNCERTGLMDLNDKPVRDLFVEHSHNARRPFWLVSENQIKTTAGRYDLAIAAVIHEHPAWSVRQIADSVGCSKSSVQNVKSRIEKERQENQARENSRTPKQPAVHLVHDDTFLMGD